MIFVAALAVIHRKITQTLGPINRRVFRDIMHAGFDFTENVRHLYIDRIFSAFDKRNLLQAPATINGYITVFFLSLC
jgi:hypothetical protein